MQKIIIKNFGPIRDAEIEIRPFTVLLGEQATGKSTVAQLVHFFNSLTRDWLGQFLKRTGDWNAFDVNAIMINTVVAKYKAYFGGWQISDQFDVKYYIDYSPEKYIHLRKQNEEVSVTFSKACDLPKFSQELSGAVSNNRLSFSNYRQGVIKDMLASFFSGDEEKPFNSSIYLIAGRNITTSFPKTFENYFIENYQEGIEETGDFKSVHLELLSQFMQYSSRMIDILSQGQYGGSILLLLDKEVKNESSQFYVDFITRLNSILKGQYSVRGGAESIAIQGVSQPIPLRQASSGQQESIRILQDLAILCANKKRHFRTIEEPEAHLFPSAQNNLTELMVMTHNHTGSYFFLTTHSPYFLSSFNNLLYAAKAAGDNLPEGEIPNPEYIKRVEELGYPKHLRLLAKDFAAYQLKDGTAESIFNPTYAVTDIDGLDAISLEIASKFEALVEIVKEAEAYETA